MTTTNRNTTGIIFNIQKFSVNDGPGIRTTVFLKECPLRCKWCANPESQLIQTQILWDQKKCINCHHCIETCPKNAMKIIDKSIKNSFNSVVSGTTISSESNLATKT